MYATIGNKKKSQCCKSIFSNNVWKIMDKCVFGNQACAACKLLCNNSTIVKTKMHCKNKNVGEINIFVKKFLKTPFISVMYYNYICVFKTGEVQSMMGSLFM